MPSPAHHAQIYTVAFAGFSEFERTAMASFFRLTVARAPAYEQLHSPSLSDFLVADADQASALQAVQYDRRLRDTVFIGAHAPPGAVAWLPRPIDPMQIVRELDSLVELRTATPEPDFDVPSVPGDERSGLSLQLPEVDTTFYATEAAPLSPPELHPHAAAVRAPTPAAEAPPTPPQPGVAPRSRNAARDVLVVEDSAIARKFLARRLQLLGYRVQLASSGEEALSLLAQHAYAIVFLDIVLGPQGSVDGLQVCHTLRKKAGHQIGPRSAVVMVTGLSGPTDRVRGTLAGCDAYLTKPLHEAEFMATLRRVDPGFEWHRGSPAPA